MTDITLGIAFIAGLVSFISPCVLPLVPAYVGYMGGRLTTQVAAIGVGGQAVVRAQRNRFGTFLHGVFFVLGFTFVFVAFGIILSAGSLALRGSVVDLQQILGRLGGLIILLFGLHVMGALPRVFAWVIGKSEQMNAGAGYLLALLAQVGIAAALAWALVTPLAMLIGVGAISGLAGPGRRVRPSGRFLAADAHTPANAPVYGHPAADAAAQRLRLPGFGVDGRGLFGRLDALHRPGVRRGVDDGGQRRLVEPGRGAAGGLFAGTGRTLSADRAGARPDAGDAAALAAPHARHRTG